MPHILKKYDIHMNMINKIKSHSNIHTMNILNNIKNTKKNTSRGSDLHQKLTGHVLADALRQDLELLDSKSASGFGFRTLGALGALPQNSSKGLAPRVSKRTVCVNQRTDAPNLLRSARLSLRWLPL